MSYIKIQNIPKENVEPPENGYVYFGYDDGGLWIKKDDGSTYYLCDLCTTTTTTEEITTTTTTTEFCYLQVLEVSSLDLTILPSYAVGDFIIISQSITIDGGKLRSITITCERIGSADFDIRAKVYTHVPVTYETDFPPSGYIGQSINTIAASDISDVDLEEITFLFDNLEVSGKFLISFEYENVILNDDSNLMFFIYEEDPNVYLDGSIVAYIAGMGAWEDEEIYSMAFSCEYCLEP